SNNNYFEAFNDSISRLVKSIIEWLDRFYILNKIKDHQDFIGLNYYCRNKIKFFKFNQNENRFVSDLGWEIYPEGIYYVLNSLKKYQKPIYITENGLADAKDKLRKNFIKDHLYWVYKAIEAGVDIRGYLHWSLMDNLEWHRGFEPEFGLIEIDYKTLERKPRPSAFYYAEVCKNNKLIIK
ncbi:MAG: family 1 glycosylhydrolase, partial [Parcubacteria group bacterium]